MEEQVITLDALRAGESGRVQSMEIEGSMRRRLQDLGLIEGTRVRCLQIAPSGSPAAYLVRGAAIALRREDARCVWVRR